MSGLFYEGEVIGVQAKEIKWTNKAGDKKSRKVHKVWMMGNGSNPIFVQFGDGDNLPEKGQMITVAVWINRYVGRDGTAQSMLMFDDKRGFNVRS